MFANDPTLYGATIPQRELPLVNPFFTQWQQQQQLPWQTFGRFVPPTYQEFFPHQQFQLPYTQGFYGNRYINQLPYFTPYMQGYTPYMQGYNLPQARWQFPFVY